MPRPRGRRDPLDVAFESAVRRFGRRRDVTGVDIGYKIKNGVRTGETSIRLHVRKKKRRGLKKSRRFPKTIHGVLVDVIQATYDNQNAALQQRVDPAQPGISIGRAGDGTGTMGLVVTDNRRAGAPAFLTAAHVLYSGSGAPGDLVMQPSPGDGASPADAIATAGRANLATDAALVLLDQGRAAHPVVALSSVRQAGPREPRLGDVLEKCGRTTGLTQGQVDGIGQYMGVTDAFRLVGLTSAQIVAAGDSGAVWYDPATGAVVGLHCKGPTTPAAGNFAIAAKLTAVSRRLAVTTA